MELRCWNILKEDFLDILNVVVPEPGIRSSSGEQYGSSKPAGPQAPDTATSV